MACITHAAETGDPKDVAHRVVVKGVTHYAVRVLAEDIVKSWFKLCDFGEDGGLILVRRPLPLPLADVTRISNAGIDCMACITNSEMPDIDDKRAGGPRLPYFSECSDGMNHAFVCGSDALEGGWWKCDFERVGNTWIRIWKSSFDI